MENRRHTPIPSVRFYVLMSALLCVAFVGGCAVKNSNANLQVVSVHYTTSEFSKYAANVQNAMNANQDPERLSSTYTVLIPNKKANDMQYGFYARLIGTAFRNSGFGIAKDAQSADYVVTFTYGIDKGVKRIVTEPITGVVGTASTFAHANVNTYGDSASINGFSYNIPQYGIVGTDTHSVTDYTKFFIMAMFNRRTGKQIMEAKAVNVGGIGNFSAVGECLVRIAFSNAFLERNGAQKTYTIGLPCL